MAGSFIRLTLILVEQSPNSNDMGDHKLIRANVTRVFWGQRREFNIAQKEDKGVSPDCRGISHSSGKSGLFEVWDDRFLNDGPIGNKTCGRCFKS